ncbi:hypothetical protein MJ904_13185 [Massilia sp. MB5]|uniref:DUF6160 domain-containing protein n=1 Tax=Pseudoduganella violacea TaxID=1715466 RepID=A0A7W5FUP7_9BURK|nr:MULTISPECIES: DUF6160 family protein [Telluria group]MBB3119378.1 hypothetical protein [Pseudoduganella violacea]UMR33030.1 hypothetical protein MJ904_13185 [Massilia sp. MB5]
MKLITTLVAAALSSLALSASAMTPIQDTELSAVTGQDGVSIFANLNVKMDSFVYTDTDPLDANGLGGGSISFNGIKATGLIAASIDILSKNSFLQAAGAVGVTNPGTFYNPQTGGDVVQIAIPADVQVAAGKLLNISVDAVKMGNNAASFGSFAMNQLDLRGTQVWIWAH